MFILTWSVAECAECNCRLLITFANSLEPDQARQNVAPDLDPNCLTLLLHCEKVGFQKNQQTTKKQTLKITWAGLQNGSDSEWELWVLIKLIIKISMRQIWWVL